MQMGLDRRGRIADVSAKGSGDQLGRLAVQVNHGSDLSHISMFTESQ